VSFGYEFLFYFFGLAAIASALTFVTRKNPVSAALWLVSTMFSLAALYVMFDAHFIGAVQVLVYAGAIMVVFVFVVMLLNLGQADEPHDFRAPATRVGGAVVGVALLAELLTVLRAPIPEIMPDSTMTTNAVTPVAEAAFGAYMLPFEITSVLLLIAIIGSVTLARRKAIQ
jgi:NADH-quinone oxidoreductase subunit J